VPQPFVLALRRMQRDVTMACDCLAHRLDNAADGPGSVRCYGSGLTQAEWQIVRPLLPVPAWLQGRGGRPEGYVPPCAAGCGPPCRRQLRQVGQPGP
jgi:hypothetical protein